MEGTGASDEALSRADRTGKAQHGRGHGGGPRAGRLHVDDRPDGADGSLIRTERTAHYVREMVAPALGDAAERLAADGRHEIRIGEDGETIRFAYPSAPEELDGYVPSEVLLEFGGRNVIDPNERHAIVPDMAALTPELDYPAADVTVLSPARTFWEKATLIHVECYRRRLADRPDRLSRHWFDRKRYADPIPEECALWRFSTARR